MSQYVPITPRAPESAGGVRAHVDRLDLVPGLGRPSPSRPESVPRVNVAVVVDEAPAGSRVLDAALTPTSEAQCARRGEAKVDSLPAGPRPLETGSELLVESRGPWERVTEAASRVDLLVENGNKRACLTLDVTSPAPDHAWRYAGATTLGLFVGGAGYARAVNGSDQTSHFGFLVGRWLGPLRLAVGTAFAVDQCSTAVCARGAKGAKEATLGLPLYLHADTYILEGRDISLGLGARYAFIATDQLQRGNPERWRWATTHSLALAPIVAWTATNPLGNGVISGTHIGTIDFEIPIGLVTPLDDYARPALSIGFDLTVTGGF